MTNDKDSPCADGASPPPSSPLLARSSGQILSAHLLGTGKRCSRKCRMIFFPRTGKVMGDFHDAGKYKRNLQELYKKGIQDSDDLCEEHAATSGAILLHVGRAVETKLRNGRVAPPKDFFSEEHGPVSAQKAVENAVRSVRGLFKTLVNIAVSHHSGFGDANSEPSFDTALRALSEMRADSAGVEFLSRIDEFFESKRGVGYIERNILGAAAEVFEFEKNLPGYEESFARHFELSVGYAEKLRKKASEKRAYLERLLLGALVLSDREDAAEFSRRISGSENDQPEDEETASEKSASGTGREKFQTLIKRIDKAASVDALEECGHLSLTRKEASFLTKRMIRRLRGRSGSETTARPEDGSSDAASSEEVRERVVGRFVAECALYDILRSSGKNPAEPDMCVLYTPPTGKTFRNLAAWGVSRAATRFLPRVFLFSNPPLGDDEGKMGGEDIFGSDAMFCPDAESRRKALSDEMEGAPPPPLFVSPPDFFFRCFLSGETSDAARLFSMTGNAIAADGTLFTEEDGAQALSMLEFAREHMGCSVLFAGERKKPPRGTWYNMVADASALRALFSPFPKMLYHAAHLPFSKIVQLLGGEKTENRVSGNGDISTVVLETESGAMSFCAFARNVRSLHGALVFFTERLSAEEARTLVEKVRRRRSAGMNTVAVCSLNMSIDVLRAFSPSTLFFPASGGDEKVRTAYSFVERSKQCITHVYESSGVEEQLNEEPDVVKAKECGKEKKSLSLGKHSGRKFSPRLIKCISHGVYEAKTF